MTTAAQLKDRYAEHKKRVRRNQAKSVQAGQDIGPLPPVADPARRRAAAASLRVFLESYFAGTFTLAWSPDQLTLIARLEETVIHGGLEIIIMPRGSGKSAITRGAAEWAVLTGRRKFVVLIAANTGKAAEEFEKIQTDFETNAELIADWPEALYPIAALERITQRQRGQTYLGKHTRITWLSTKIVLPTIAGSVCSGSILTCAGLQSGKIRGQSHKTPSGKLLRPDFALPDDPQTDDSAASDLQCERREKLLCGAVLGMSGPRKKMAVACCATVIRKGDLADRLLDRKRHPEWRGERMKALKSWPTRMDLWEQYREVRRGGDQAGANKLYRTHRAEMDQGAEAAWPERFNEDELSAVQRCMNWWIDEPEAFAAEGQGEPFCAADDPDRPTLEKFTDRINKLKRGIIPVWANHIVVMIDVQEKALYWKALAAADDFTAAIVDYGTEPEQQSQYFALREIQSTITKALAAAGKEGGIEAAIYYALECLTERLFTRTWKREDGVELTLEKAVVDSGDQTKTVYEFCRRSKWKSMLLPSKGAGITAGKAPIDKWKIQTHEKRGDGFVITSDSSARAVRLVRFDTNHWKTFVSRRAAVAGGKGSLTVWGDDPREHRMLQDHCNAERCVKTIAADGRTVWEWSLKPGGPDNHYFDTLVGGYVALATIGCKLVETGPTPTRKKFRVTYF